MIVDDPGLVDFAASLARLVDTLTTGPLFVASIAAVVVALLLLLVSGFVLLRAS